MRAAAPTVSGPSARRTCTKGAYTRVSIASHDRSGEDA